MNKHTVCHDPFASIPHPHLCSDVVPLNQIAYSLDFTDTSRLLLLYSIHKRSQMTVVTLFTNQRLHSTTWLCEEPAICVFSALQQGWKRVGGHLPDRDKGSKLGLLGEKWVWPERALIEKRGFR